MYTIDHLSGEMFNMKPTAVSERLLIASHVFLLIYELRDWEPIPLNARACSAVVFGCDLPSAFIIAWPCAGVEGLSSHIQR